MERGRGKEGREEWSEEREGERGSGKERKKMVGKGGIG